MVLGFVKRDFPVPSEAELERLRAAKKAEKEAWREAEQLPREGAALGPPIPMPVSKPSFPRRDTFFFPTAKRADSTYSQSPNRGDDDDRPF